MKKAVTLVMVVVATGLLAAGASAGKVHKHVRYVKLVVEQGFFVDSDPSGQSGGDLFGSSGVLRHHSRQVGTFSAACESSGAEGGLCNVSLLCLPLGDAEQARAADPEQDSLRTGAFTGASLTAES